MSAIVRALIRHSVVWLVPLSMLNLGVAVAAGPVPAQQQAPARVPQQTRLQAQAPATMPDLVGLTPRAAAEHAAVRRSRLQLVVEEGPGANSPEGVVFKQSLAPGTTIRPGTRVTIWIATRGVVVPSVVRLMLDAARDRLVRAGFRLEVVRVRSTAAVAGAVVSQEPEAGTRRPRGSTVRITVVAPEQTPPDVPDAANSGIEVPRLVGLVDREAAASLERIGLKGQRRLVQIAGATPGVVVEQLPLPGTRVGRGSTVLVTVADAPVNQEEPRPTPDPTAPMPDLVGRTFEAALEDARVIHLRLQILRDDDRLAAGRPGVIVRQSIAPGERVKPGTRVVATVPTGVIVPLLLRVPVDAASQQLRDAGLQPRVSVVKAARDHGLVIDQVPSAGTRVSRGAAVGVSVASVETAVPTPPPDPSPQEPPRPPDKAPTDPAPFLPRMPDLVGRTFEAGVGDGWVQQLRLQLVQEDDRLADGKPGLIVRQSIAAGQPVRPGSRVVVAVATGVIVPPLLRVPIETARQQVSNLGLQARITEVKGRGDPGLVFEQVPSAGTRVSRGAAVGLRVAVVETTVVPNVVGRTRGEADGAIAASRLTTEFVEDAASDRSPGVVSTQQPQPDTTVNVGSSVRMAIATGAVVPAVIDRTFEAARDAIAAAGLLVDARSVRVSGTASGRVLSQTPQAGVRVARGTVIRVEVAAPPSVSVTPTEPPAVTVVVPDLVGRVRTDAVGLLAAVKLGPVFSEREGTEPPGTVVRQQPAPGTLAPAGTLVSLVIVRPPPPPIAAATARQTALPAVSPTRPTPSKEPPLNWPPWLMSVGLIGLVAWRFVKANMGGAAARAVPATAAPPPLADVRLEPHCVEGVARLEVTGRSLVQFEVRLRPAIDEGQQNVHSQGTLTGDERRIYE